MLSLIAALALQPAAIPPDLLAADLKVLRRALDELHPGLDLHQSREVYERSWKRLERDWSRPADRRALYLSLSRHLAQIRCGHTYANFFNQTDAVAREVFDGRDKLPFTFRIVNKRALVTESDAIPVGSEVLSIGGRSFGLIVGDLARYVKGDGRRDDKRIEDLQLSGLGRFEAFDVFQPLLLPPFRGRFDVVYRPRGVFVDAQASLEAVDRDERRRRLGLIEPAPWEHKVLPSGVGYLRLGSFTTWNFRFDWRSFLDEAFRRFKQESPKQLILDIRGNEGGSDEVADALMEKIGRKAHTRTQRAVWVRFREVPADLGPHLETWDRRAFELGKGADGATGGFFRLKDRPSGRTEVPANPDAFQGRVWVLVGPSNSSATHYLAERIKESGLATLVGRPTGGSRRGMQGGQFLMVRLPNTGFEVDVPLIGWRDPKAPDAGVAPDYPVKWIFDEVADGRDPDLEAALRLAKLNPG